MAENVATKARLPKVDNVQAIRRSVQEFTDPDAIGPALILHVATAAEEAPQWWSPQRDKYLDEFWPEEPFLSGAIYSVASRNSSFRYELTGPERDVWWAQRLLNQADFGQGWQSFIMKLTLDLLCQDNGCFFEIIRPAKTRVKGQIFDAIKMPNGNGEPAWIPYNAKTGKFLQGLTADVDFKVTDSPFDLPIGLAHLDAQRCTRTGNPQHPVIYIDLDGNHHKLNWHQVCSLEDMPSPREEMYGVGHCAVSRSLRLAQILRDMLIYKHEKISGRFARAIHITNIDAALLQDAVQQSYADADNRGLLRYIQPVILSTVDPNATPAVETIQLASLPDGFDEEVAMRWYIAGLANALGVDYGFLSPLPGNKLGTSTQAETQERQARGKSSRLFMQLMTYKFNHSGILPRTVSFQFATSDPFVESEKDRALARRARAYQTMIQSGLLPIEVVQQIAADRGDIDGKYLDMLGVADMTPIVTVSGTDVRRVTRHR
jgi:hypothetical protein